MLSIWDMFQYYELWEDGFITGKAKWYLSQNQRKQMISLIHPSRGRPTKSACNVREWIDMAGRNIEVIVSVDMDDHLPMYYAAYMMSTCKMDNDEYRILPSENNCVVQATNKAASVSSGDILVYLSDDFKCPGNWAVLIEAEFAKYSGPTLIKVDDCLQQFHVPVLTIPMMNRELYEKLGYFWHPGYKSMFVDEDLYWTAKKLGALQLAPHLKFPHDHVSIGKAENDDTYRRSAANWEQGKAFFKQRRGQGFPV